VFESKGSEEGLGSLEGGRERVCPREVRGLGLDPAVAREQDLGLALEAVVVVVLQLMRLVIGLRVVVV
jgi:hypothetical protein